MRHAEAKTCVLPTAKASCKAEALEDQWRKHVVKLEIEVVATGSGVDDGVEVIDVVCETKTGKWWMKRRW